MKVVNIIDRIDKVNFGIWNAALSTSKILAKKYGVESIAVFPKIDDMPHIKNLYDAESIALDTTSLERFNDVVERFSPSDTIVVSHGAWRFPSVWACKASEKGFSWVYTPHGMLEPWGMNNKWIKKKIYFNFYEKSFVKKSSFVRAVSSVEKKNLEKYFRNVVLIPNGAEFISANSNVNKPYTFLFLGRLNSKKCVVELLNAWRDSPLVNNVDFRLQIIGPDDGEYAVLKNTFDLLPKNHNVSLSNSPVYGNDKQNLLLNSLFFILPSQSEGFPTSIIEAGLAGCIPVFTDGCNFPELEQCGLGIKIGSSYASLLNLFKKIAADEFFVNDFDKKKVTSFFKENYTVEKIADMQFGIYNSLLKK